MDMILKTIFPKWWKWLGITGTILLTSVRWLILVAVLHDLY